MDVGLEWLGVGVGLLGGVVSYMVACYGPRPSAESQVSNRRLVYSIVAMTAVLTLAVWLVSSMKEGLFSAGQSMGIGFAIGGALGIVAQLLSVRLDSVIREATETRSAFISALCPGFLGLLGVSVVKRVFHGYPQEALMGFAMAVLMSGILLCYIRVARGERHSHAIESWAIFSVSLSVAVVLAVMHFDSVQLRIWWSIPLLIASTLLVAGYVAAEICSATSMRNRPGALYVLVGTISAIITIGMAALYSWRLVQTWQLLFVVIGAVAAAAIVAWTIAGTARRFDRSSGLEAGAVAVIVVLAGYVGMFKLWGGLGAAVGATAAWSLILPSLGVMSRRDGPDDEDSKAGTEPPPNPLRNEGGMGRCSGWRLADLLPAAMLGSVALLVSLAVFRIFLEKYRSDVGGLDVRIHYTYVGAVVGAVVPFLLLSAIGRIRSFAAGPGFARDLCAMVCVGLVGLAAAAAPVVLCLVWGTRAALGLVYGLPLALAFWIMYRLTNSRDDTDDPVICCPVSLLVLGSGVTAAQMVGFFTARDFSRTTSVTVLAVSVGLVALWVALSSLTSRKQTQ